jgi:aldehyde dehydrogenase (NAD+)
VDDRTTYDAFIDASDVPAQDGRTIPIVDPASGESFAVSARCGASEVDAAVASARAAQPAWRDVPPLDRGRILVRLAQAVRANGARLARMESLTAGKVPREANIDVEVTAQFLEFYGGLATGLEGATFGDRADQFSYTTLEPYGVTGHIIPWNFPMQTAVRSIAPALATGNAVVAKPAEQTPITCLELARLAVECGLPPGVFNVVPGYGTEAGAALAGHPRVPRLTFTGSVATGKRILHAAADHLCHATVELGGKSPLVIFADADVEQAIAGVAKAILTHAGQVCAAGTRMLVQAPIHDEMVAALQERMDAVRPGAAEDGGIAPLVSPAQLERVRGYIERGRAEGATLVTSDAPVETDGGYYVRPALFADVTPDMTISQEEIFGPVLGVTRFEAEGEAAELANASPYGLVAGIWTRDITKALRLARAIEAGTIYVNDYYIGGVDLPFGGFKDSGFGREKGRQALESFVRSKSVAIALHG